MIEKNLRTVNGAIRMSDLGGCCYVDPAEQKGDAPESHQEKQTSL